LDLIISPKHVEGSRLTVGARKFPFVFGRHKFRNKTSSARKRQPKGGGTTGEPAWLENKGRKGTRFAGDKSGSVNSGLGIPKAERALTKKPAYGRKKAKTHPRPAGTVALGGRRKGKIA